MYVAGYLENLKGGNMIKNENTIDLLIMNNYTYKMYENRRKHGKLVIILQVLFGSHQLFSKHLLLRPVECRLIA